MLSDRLACGASSEEIKSEIKRRVGVKNADQYFLFLGRYLSNKLCKPDFNRLCIRSIGRENLSLHNRLIYTILKTASSEQTPAEKRKAPGSLSVRIDNEYKGSCLQSLCKDGFPVSPRKPRTPFPRGRKFRDMLSPPGPLEKTPNVISDGSPYKVLEQSGATELLSLGSRPRMEMMNSVEDGEEVEQTASCQSVRSTSPVTAPFGICINGRGSKKLLNHDSSTGAFNDTCFALSELPDTNSLRERLKNKVKAEGLDVSLDFVNCLNHGVDMFLKRLISPTLKLSGLRSNTAVLQQEHSRVGPGMNGTWPTRYSNKLIKSATPALDFRVAMELNPTILGDDWQIHLERICSQAEN